jgi:hypothetical protein
MESQKRRATTDFQQVRSSLRRASSDKLDHTSSITQARSHKKAHGDKPWAFPFPVVSLQLYGTNKVTVPLFVSVPAVAVTVIV